jgi:hypothetical protein
MGLVGCGPMGDELASAEHFLTAAEEDAIVAFVNEASFEVLDDDVALDRRAAENIVGHRDGPDGVLGTADDDPFDDLAELDAIPYVGPVALEKLRAWVEAQGLVNDATSPSCVIISEYIEGQGNYNKAIELFNCGTAPVDTARLGVCLVRNADTACSVTAMLPGGSLSAGEVTTVCRKKEYTFNDPMAGITNGCLIERSGVMTFNGDDRVAIFFDANQSGSYDAGELLDMLGRFGYQPPVTTWADKTLRRCNLTPSDGTSFYQHESYFTTHPWASQEHYGLPPTASCP